jgi:HSP20 family protein
MTSLSLRRRRNPFAELDALVRAAFGPVYTTHAWFGPMRLREPGQDQTVRRAGVSSIAFRPLSRLTGFMPAADITQDGDDAVVRVDLPGLTLDDINVEIEGGQLVVRGERRDERAEDSDGHSMRQVSYGSFKRSFGLPGHVTADAIDASYDAGVLTVRVAGAYAGAGSQRITISSGSESSSRSVSSSESSESSDN